jgi:DNA replication protein
MAELKVTLYAFWAMGQKEGQVRYLRLTDFLNDTEFVKGLGPTTTLATEALMDGIERAVARGTFLHVNIESADGVMDLYFFNTFLIEKGRAAFEGITKGEWRPNPDEDEPITLLVERPNIFILYEQNIGPLTPMVADELRDAEQTIRSVG